MDRSNVRSNVISILVRATPCPRLAASAPRAPSHRHMRHNQEVSLLGSRMSDHLSQPHSRTHSHRLFSSKSSSLLLLSSFLLSSSSSSSSWSLYRPVNRIHRRDIFYPSTSVVSPNISGLLLLRFVTFGSFSPSLIVYIDCSKYLPNIRICSSSSSSLSSCFSVCGWTTSQYHPLTRPFSKSTT